MKCEDKAARRGEKPYRVIKRQLKCYRQDRIMDIEKDEAEAQSVPVDPRVAAVESVADERGNDSDNTMIYNENEDEDHFAQMQADFHEEVRGAKGGGEWWAEGEGDGDGMGRVMVMVMVIAWSWWGVSGCGDTYSRSPPSLHITQPSTDGSGQRAATPCDNAHEDSEVREL